LFISGSNIEPLSDGKQMMMKVMMMVMMHDDHGG
jgi:hypothetical protein